MSPSHAVVWIDHQSAEVLHIDPGHEDTVKVKAHHHATRQHGSKVRTEHEFFGNVCDAAAGIDEILVTGSSTALADFRHYVARHRSPLEAHLVGWETVDQPTLLQLCAMGRKFFARYDQMAGATVTR